MRYSHIFHHIIISQIATIIALWFGLNIFSFFAPVIFYTFREFWQYNNRVIKSDKFDYDGCVPVAITQSLMCIAYYL